MTLASDRATGQESVRLKGLNGGVATVTRASKDGTLLIGTSRTELPWSVTVTTWAAPDWQPREVPTPQSFDYWYIDAVSADGRVIGGNTAMWDAHIWWDGLNASPTVYGGASANYWVWSLSASGNSAIGVGDDEHGILRSCVYSSEGVRFLAALPGDEWTWANCLSPSGTTFAGSMDSATTDDTGKTLYRSVLAAWIDGVPEVLPRPDGFDYAFVREINDSGDRAVGFAAKRASNGSLVSPLLRTAWHRVGPGQWTIVMEADYIDEVWGEMRVDGRRRLGFTASSEGPTIRDVFHGDRSFLELLQRMFPETGDDGVYPVTCAMRDGRIAVWSIAGSWIITLPVLADVNEDGVLDIADAMMFVDAVVAGESRADWNLDGQLTFEDFDAFVADYESGTR
ncbi:MAG: GC-type dockerin domain-anchored protein [Planctomycetota bacterium]|nr:GC-type dockerin domain-anchored protein [Planctomycetota bacterium]